jgi:hypothetical protein
MSPSDSGSSEFSFSEDFDDASGAVQAQKRLALEKNGRKHRFMLSNDDDLSDITTSDDFLDDAPGAFQARKRLALEKYGYKDRFKLFKNDDNSEIDFSEITTSDRPPSESSSSTKKKRTSSVRFSTVSVRSFDRTVGDHPCREGPALSLDWGYRQLPNISVDTYETARKPKRGKLFPWERRKILSCWNKKEKTQAQTENAPGNKIFNNIRKLFCYRS